MADNPESTSNQTPNQNPEMADAARSDRAQLDPEMADALTRLYWERRIHYQLSYYQKKVRDFEDNVDNAFRLGAILMTVASLLAALGVFVQSIPSLAALLALATAMIPAFASYITAFRQLYNWDRQLTIYRDTQLNLERSRMLLPDLDALTPEESHQLFPQLVQEVEGVLEKEAAQWGQITVDKDDKEGEVTEEFAETYAAALADSSGEIDQRKLDALSGILESASGTPDAGQYRLKPDELETESPLLPDDFYGYSEEESRERRDRAKAAAQAASQQTTASDSSPIEPPSLPPTVEDDITSENQAEDDTDTSAG
jgi:SMODS and SLOG-associating 2TM effector domain 1